jgi:signal transduction histidine kinase
MLDRIQSSVNQLHTVTGSVAHDLKSPVTSIRGTLESTLCESGNVNWRESVGEAIENLDRLLLLLNTTLDLAEADAGALQLDRTRVDLSVAVARLVDLYQPAMTDREHKITLDLEEHVVVEADSSLLNRMISNLLENELTHLPAGHLITVRLRSHGGSAELWVEDDGPGFPPEIIPRAFERFVKGRRSPGHGLGLAFVNAIAQAHGGTVNLIAQPGAGAVITVSLPVGVLQPS